MNIATDTAINAAKDVPTLITNLKAVNSPLAELLIPKALIASKTVWGSAISMVVSWSVTHWALGWDADTCATVTGLITLAITTAARWRTKAPIGGVISTDGVPHA